MKNFFLFILGLLPSLASSSQGVSDKRFSMDLGVRAGLQFNNHVVDDGRSRINNLVVNTRYSGIIGGFYSIDSRYLRLSVGVDYQPKYVHVNFFHPEDRSVHISKSQVNHNFNFYGTAGVKFPMKNDQFLEFAGGVYVYTDRNIRHTEENKIYKDFYDAGIERDNKRLLMYVHLPDEHLLVPGGLMSLGYYNNNSHRPFHVKLTTAVSIMSLKGNGNMYFAAFEDSYENKTLQKQTFYYNGIYHFNVTYNMSLYKRRWD